MVYIPEIRTLGDVPRHFGRVRPDVVATVFRGRETTYANWNAATNRVAQGLVAEGAVAGARIGYLGRNTDTYFDLLFGAAKTGAVMVPVNWRLAQREIVEILNDAEVRVVFVEAEFLPIIQSARGEAPTVQRTVVLGEYESGDFAVCYEPWLAERPDTDPELEVDPASTALQIYTSGTTGLPKGVQLSHAMFYAVDRHRRDHPEDDTPEMAWNDWTAEDVNVVAMPVFHISGTGWAICGLMGGATNVILSQYDIDELARAFAERPVSRLLLVPAAIQQLLRSPQCASLDFSSLRWLTYGASPIPVDLLREAVERIGCNFVQMYGLTESGGAVTHLPANDHQDTSHRRLKSAGKAVPGAKLTIRDGEGRILPPGEIGEICIQSLTMMNGYWKNQTETDRALTSYGYLRSGDAGLMDEDGYLYIKDRVKDMIVTGGENVYPAEVENALFSHPAISEISVIGVPSAEWGEAVKAVVVLKPGGAADAADIIAYGRKRLAGFKLPKSVDFVSDLPRNATGKVLKRELRAQYWAGRERQVN